MRRFLVAIGLCVAAIISCVSWAENPIMARSQALIGKATVLSSTESVTAKGATVRNLLLDCPGRKYPRIVSQQLLKPVPAGMAADGAEVAISVEFVADHLMVQPKAGIDEEQFRATCAGLGFTVHRRVSQEGPFLVSFPSDGVASVVDAIVALRESGIVQDAEPDYLVYSLATPNDPQFYRQWNMNIIAAPTAWDKKVDGSSVGVAVIDTGIDYLHPDLINNIWLNPRESYDASGNPVKNGADTDGNGFVDDHYGWDFASGVGRDGDPMDNLENPDSSFPLVGHGTHCAGVIGAVTDNSIGVAGINWRARVAAVRFLDGDGTGYLSDSIAAIDYVTNMPSLKLSNNSWGGWCAPNMPEIPPAPGEDPNEQGLPLINALSAAIQRANLKGKLFVCAAGNDAFNVDTYWTDIHGHNFYCYPPYLNQENMITVAATGPDDTLSSYSNYSDSRVHLVAPGGEIDAQANQVFSTIPREINGYGYMAGTSMASPHVAGAATMLHSLQPQAKTPPEDALLGWHHLQVRARILGTVDRLPSLFGYCDTYGRLNLNRALPVTTASFLRLLFPVGTENFVPGNTYKIRWVSNLASNIKIDLYKGDAFHSTIAASAPTDAVGQRDDDHGEYNWFIPLDHETGGDFSIRLTSLSGGLRDESFTKFSITGVPGECYLTIMAYPKAGGTTDPVPGTYGPYASGQTINIAALPVAPYVFDRWFSTPNGTLGSATAAATTVRITGNTTVIAYFVLDAGDALKLQVMRYPPAFGTTDPTGTTYVAAGVPVDIEATPLVDPPHLYEFLRWDILNANYPWDPNCVIADPYAAVTTITCFKNTQVVARFYRTTNYLTVSSNTGGTVLPKGRQIVEVGAALPIETTLTDPSREFICWSHSANVTVADVTAMATDATLEWTVSPMPPTNNPANQEGWVRANYQPIGALATLTMKSSPATLGDVTNPDTGTKTVLAPHAVQAITADAAPSGYAFTHWSVVGDGEIADPLNPVTTVTVHWNCTVTANYVRTVQLTTAVVGPGAVTTPAASPVDVNINEWVDIVAAPGADFIMWTGTAGAVIENPGLASTRVRLSASATVTAHFVAAANLTDVCVGSTFTIAAADVGLGTFTFKPVVTARTYDLDKRIWRTVPVSLVNFTMGDAVLTCRWTGLVSLFNRDLFLRYYQRRAVNGSGGLGGDANEFVLVDGNVSTLNFILHVQSREILPRFLNQGVTLVPPVITGVETRNGDPIAAAHAGGILVVTGNYFGSNLPAVWLENEGPDTIIRQTRCRVLTPYSYPNHLGVANRSPMDPPTGASEVWIKIPNKLPAGWDHAAPHNLVLRNFHAMGDIPFGTIDPAVNTFPVAVNDAFNVAVNSRGNILDILANDEDAEADDVRIILGVPDSGGKISVVNRRVVYTPARGFSGAETFTYLLDDRHSDGMGLSNIATVTINVP